MRWQTMIAGFVAAALVVTVLAADADAQSRRQRRANRNNGGGSPAYSQPGPGMTATPYLPFTPDSANLVQPTLPTGTQPTETGGNLPAMNGNLPTTTSFYQPSGQTATVALNDIAFAQGQMQVAPGTKVLFTNRGNGPHNITSGQGLFDSGVIPPGATYDCTFNGPGTYTYYDRNNPNIRGTIIVR